jgi:hypothetical protein
MDNFNRDKNGKLLIIGDIVLVEVFIPKLYHTGITTMLGKIFIGPDYNNFFIDLGGSIRGIYRRSYQLELANELRQEYYEQIASYDKLLMLWKLEN